MLLIPVNRISRRNARVFGGVQFQYLADEEAAKHFPIVRESGGIIAQCWRDGGEVRCREVGAGEEPTSEMEALLAAVEAKFGRSLPRLRGPEAINYPLLTLRSFVRLHRPVEEDAGGEDGPRGPELEDSGERPPLGGLEPRDSRKLHRRLADRRVRRCLGPHAVASERDLKDFGRVLGDDVDGGVSIGIQN